MSKIRVIDLMKKEITEIDVPGAEQMGIGNVTNGEKILWPADAPLPNQFKDWPIKKATAWKKSYDKDEML